MKRKNKTTISITEYRQITRDVKDAVTKIYLSLSMCEHGDDFSDHENCRLVIKKRLGRIQNALDKPFLPVETGKTK
jgi:hypothetical protein